MISEELQQWLHESEENRGALNALMRAEEIGLQAALQEQQDIQDELTVRFNEIQFRIQEQAGGRYKFQQLKKKWIEDGREEAE